MLQRISTHQHMETSLVLSRILPFIRERGYQPGERIPSERELAERFQVSRGILREALATLEAMRVLERRPQSGIYLLDVATQASVDMVVLESELGMPKEGNCLTHGALAATFSKTVQFNLKQVRGTVSIGANGGFHGPAFFDENY